MTRFPSLQTFPQRPVHGPCCTRPILAVRFAHSSISNIGLRISNLKPFTADPASAAQYTPHQEVRAPTYAPTATPTSEYTATPASARSSNFPQDYLARQQHQQQHYAQNSHAAASMAQATSPSMSLPDGHHHNHNTPNIKSNPDVPIDPSIASTSPTGYPGPYSPYPPQNHDMSQYPGHAPQGYAQWPHGYGHPHGMPGGPYSSPGTAVSAGGSAATAGPPRPGQVSVAHFTPVRLLSHSQHRILTRFHRSTLSSPFLVLSSTNVLVVAMKKSSACTSVGSKDVRKLMVLSIT